MYMSHHEQRGSHYSGHSFLETLVTVDNPVSTLTLADKVLGKNQY